MGTAWDLFWIAAMTRPLLALIAAWLASQVSADFNHRGIWIDVDDFLEVGWQNHKIQGDKEAVYELFYVMLPQLRVKGFSMVEGLAFHNGVWFIGDLVKNQIYTMTDEDGASVLMRNAGQCSQSDWSLLHSCGPSAILPNPRNNNTIYFGQYGLRRIIEYDLSSAATRIIASHFGDYQLNGPHDMATYKDGQYIYFTDPFFRFVPKGFDIDEAAIRAASHTRFEGVYRVNVQSGQVELLDKIYRVSGIDFSPDFSKLYVSQCCEGSTSPDCLPGHGYWITYRVDDNGGIHRERVIKIATPGPGCSAGFEVLPHSGDLIASCPGGVCLVNATSGHLRTKIDMKTRIGNVELGDKALMIAAQNALFELPRRIKPLFADEKWLSNPAPHSEL
eukprot:c32499_g1_i1.p1 GENE.c32499_g1_i1~~c32499_g1_i1.p1  ORF type:complete len:389 (-),score=74.73 c32499_g1_i1:136-1302(-)